GGAQGHHRQLRRTRPDRHGAARRALSGRPERRPARRDRAGALGNAAGVRRRGVLPRLRPGPLRHRADTRGRRRVETVPVLRRYITPWRVVGTIALLLVVTILVLLRIPSGQYILLPDIAHPVAPLVKVA